MKKRIRLGKLAYNDIEDKEMYENALDNTYPENFYKLEAE